MYTDYLTRKIRRRKIVITVSITLIFVLLFVTISANTNYSLGHFYKKVNVEDASCHYVREGDALRAIDEQFFPSSNSIFFHETSCSGKLNSLQACAIESAARTHPDWEIHVFFSAPVNKLALGDVNIEFLKLMSNVMFTRVHIEDYAKGTPLEELVSSGAVNRTLWPIRHTKDVLRYLTLYKWGGIVLDLDIIVTQPLTDLGRNWAIKDENWDFVRSEALAFDRDSAGTLIADAAARLLARNFDVVWGQYRGNRVITDALEEVCNTDDIVEMTSDACLGFEVYPPTIMLPLDLGNRDTFKESDYNQSDVFFYQIVNQPLRNRKANYKDSISAKLSKKYCPIIAKNYRHLFGS